ncbi:MAG: diaminopimelate epimerase [Deltaproteobacteria bacterium RBG_16_54_18]|nr:MAG: diaminopimelate epimerase [Deltaproteobacteria bacterium RBG_16_54_18]
MIEHLEFYKMTGGGNDFILIDNHEGKIDADALRRSVPLLCRHKLSVGADGVIVLERSAKAHFRWRFFNADGSEAEMCGNGGRCAARLAHLVGLAPAELTFETLAGIIKARVKGSVVKLTLPPPVDVRLGITLPVGEEEVSVDFINTGVPHVVVFAPDLQKIDVVGLGRKLRHHEAFQPAGTNVDFITIDNGTVSLRTYERGVEDETLACGTGAVAAAVIAGMRGLATSPTTVITRGGEPLTIYYEGGAKVQEVSLEGEVRMIYRGWFDEEAIG